MHDTIWYKIDERRKRSQLGVIYFEVIEEVIDEKNARTEFDTVVLSTSEQEDA